LTSDGRSTPLLFPVPASHVLWIEGGKKGAGAHYGDHFYPERAVACATCVTVADVTSGGDWGGSCAPWIYAGFIRRMLEAPSAEPSVVVGDAGAAPHENRGHEMDPKPQIEAAMGMNKDEDQHARQHDP
jgi:hypothetical protein